jgi:acetoacetyl-[acyl-carrier protein] synthase
VTLPTSLPVIVGFGGFNAAGRSSFHQAYKRMVFESLGQEDRRATLAGLASLMGLVSWRNGEYHSRAGQALETAQIEAEFQERILAGTLVRRIESQYFDVDHVPVRRALHFSGNDDHPTTFVLPRKQLPDPIPTHWQVSPLDDARVRVTCAGEQEVMIETTQAMPVQAAGQLPTGFDPAAHYRSLFHPRGLQLSILAASDALHSIGVPWNVITDRLRPEEIGVYSSSVMSQLDGNGYAGMMQARLRGSRVSSKQLALGLNTMPADFVNAYVLGSLGSTGGVTGACATFLYNLRQGVEDIRSGRRRIVFVGSTEAPILPEVIDGYAAMGALATDANLAKLDGGKIDHRRASRPFGQNCGFTIAESGQYAVLMDDALALELGAEIYGAVPGVYVNADGFKKSISSPGPGNYLTMGKAVGLARSLLGDRALQQHSFIQAHGSSTPQNRVTESQIFDKVASAFGIESWPVAAVKAYLGHSLGPASGDQLAATLGVFKYGLLPGIKTIDAVAEDVFNDRLRISTQDQQFDPQALQVAFLNSKGFGGNNATATVLAPGVVERFLAKRHGADAWARYQAKREGVRDAGSNYAAAADRGELNAVYQFDAGVIDESAMAMDAEHLSLPGYGQPVALSGNEGYDDFSQ